MSVIRAYDNIAKHYDAQLSSDFWIRRILWERYLETFPRGSHLLDVGCGTGIDALFLARHGIHVTGIDISRSMVAVLLEKAESEGLSEYIEAYVAHLDELSTWPSSPQFDGIISAFGSLNTVDNLFMFSDNAARLVRSGGHVIVHMVNPSSLWEWIYLFGRGRWRRATQLSKETERLFPISGINVRHSLVRPLTAYSRYFERHFSLVQCFGIGILRPPPNKSWISPCIETALGKLESTIRNRRPFLNWGRFYVLEMNLRVA